MAHQVPRWFWAAQEAHRREERQWRNVRSRSSNKNLSIKAKREERQVAGSDPVSNWWVWWTHVQPAMRNASSCLVSSCCSFCGLAFRSVLSHVRGMSPPDQVATLLLAPFG